MKRKKPELRTFRIFAPVESVETHEYEVTAESAEDALHLYLKCPGAAEWRSSTSGGEFGLYTVREIGNKRVKKFRTKK